MCITIKKALSGRAGSEGLSIIYRIHFRYINEYSMPDYFEIDRLIEDLAKIYSTACATTWFKMTENKQPTKEEFRKKVVEFMKHFEYTLSTYPKSKEGDQFRQYVNNNLKIEIERVLEGNNKEVERRYKYYVDYS